MASLSDFPAVGKVFATAEDHVIFVPQNSNYELKLLTGGKFPGTAGVRVEGLIRVTAKKVYTVASGGNFISPIFGPPKTIQGRVRYIDDRHLVVQAGCPIVVELPAVETSYDQGCGPMAVGTLVNVVALPGATFEPLVAAAKA
jgi:hypothetical protein